MPLSNQKNDLKVEVCAFSLESCQAAEIARANRIELCGGFYEGGTTPSAGLISLVKKNIDLELFVMIRPRGGDFLYSKLEKKVMMADIEMAKKLGAHGIVIGLLQKNGEVDRIALKEMIDLAYPLTTAFHRAIDVTPEPITAMETILEAGCVRILTSGQQNKAIDGINTIELLVNNANNRIEIMVGAGVDSKNAHYFLEKGVNALHLTGKSIRQSQMEFRNKNVSMGGMVGISEFEVVYTDPEKIKTIVDIIKKYSA
jgi:copper homeostasis protein